MALNIGNFDIVSVVVRGSTHGQLTMLTLNYRYAGPVQVFSTYATALKVAFQTVGGVLQTLSTVAAEDWLNWVLDIQLISPVRYRKVTAIPTIVNGSGGAAAQANLACALTLHGDIASRRTVAVKHIISPDAGLVGGAGVFDAGYISNMQLLGNALGLVLSTGTGTSTPVIYGRARPAYTQDGVLHPALPELVTEITGHTIGDTVRVMRRRTVRVGA